MDEITRKDLIEQAKAKAENLNEQTDTLRKSLIEMAEAFATLADIKYMEMSLLCKTYFQSEDPAFAEELSKKLSRPIAFGLPNELTEDKLLILVVQTAMDCLEEMELSREACSIIDPNQLAYSNNFYEKALEIIKNNNDRQQRRQSLQDENTDTNNTETHKWI